MGEVSVLKTRNTNKSVPEKSRVQFRKEQVEDEGMYRYACNV